MSKKNIHTTRDQAGRNEMDAMFRSVWEGTRLLSGAETDLPEQEISSQNTGPQSGQPEGGPHELAHQSFRTSYHEIFIEIFSAYSLNLRKSGLLDKINKLYLSSAVSRILVWIELAEDNWETEKQLLLLEAELNARYQELGFMIQTDIVTAQDRWPLPDAFVELKLT